MQIIPSYLLWTLEQLYIAQTSAELACPFFAGQCIEYSVPGLAFVVITFYVRTLYKDPKGSVCYV